MTISKKCILTSVMTATTAIIVPQASAVTLAHFLPGDNAATAYANQAAGGATVSGLVANNRDRNPIIPNQVSNENSNGNLIFDTPANATGNNFIFFTSGETNGLGTVNDGASLEFSVSVGPGQYLSLSSLSFNFAQATASVAGGGSLVTLYKAYYSTDGGANYTEIDTVSAGFISSPTADTYYEVDAPKSYDLATATAGEMASTYDFYIAIYSPGSPAGSYNAMFQNIKVDGDVVAVPEPSSLALGGLGVFGLLLRRRRA